MGLSCGIVWLSEETNAPEEDMIQCAYCGESLKSFSDVVSHMTDKHDAKILFITNADIQALRSYLLEADLHLPVDIKTDFRRFLQKINKILTNALDLGKGGL